MAPYPTILENGACLNSINDSEINKVHIIQNFMLFSLSEFRNKLSYNGSRSQSDNEILEIQKELHNVLQANLNHKMVGRVHAIVSGKVTVDYLIRLKLSNAAKLIMQNVSNDTKTCL